MHIISVDGEMKGYLSDNTNLASVMTKLVDELISKAEQPTTSKLFTEKLENGYKIYRQTVGKYFNGIVECIHHITFQEIEELKF